MGVQKPNKELLALKDGGHPHAPLKARIDAFGWVSSASY
jgi:hypothetical protein